MLSCTFHYGNYDIKLTPLGDPKSHVLVNDNLKRTNKTGHLNILAWSWMSEPQKCKLRSGLTCDLVTDKQMYNHSEAVVFNLGHSPAWNNFPKYRFPYQKWVVLEYEPPPVCEGSWPKPPFMDQLRSIFNVTIFPVADATLTYPALVYNYPLYFIDTKRMRWLMKFNTNYSATKTRNVAWFVSNCRTQSRREDYVTELQKYIDVDVYGKCGNLSCGHSGGGRNAYCDHSVLDKMYRFYLSFENSLCEGYVTEKMKRLIERPITTIPIVMGFMNYSMFLPEKTYIDTKDFESPKALADYLKHISEHPELFNEYINRKNSLNMLRNHAYNKSLICLLCDFLHQNYDKHFEEPDIKSFWSVGKRCVDPWKVIPGSFWGV